MCTVLAFCFCFSFFDNLRQKDNNFNMDHCMLIAIHFGNGGFMCVCVCVN